MCCFGILFCLVVYNRGKNGEKIKNLGCVIFFKLVYINVLC